jgi:rod shape-determining protein MreC
VSSPWQRSHRARRTSWGRTGGGADVNPFALLLVTLSLGIGLGILHNRWLAKRRPDPLMAGVSTFIFPFQSGTAHIEASLLLGWDWLFAGRPLAEENARLTAENARLRLENEALRVKAEEADRLRAALKFMEAQKRPPLITSVIGWLPSPHYESITIARGTRSEVHLQSIVRTPEGLVGQVFAADAVSSQVMLLTDLDSRVSATLYRNGKPLGYVGIVQGQGRGEPLEMVYLRREDDVRPGDAVVSSGFGGVFPPGIPIGTVTGVLEDRPRFLKSALVAPAAPHPGDLREVLVLR